jgi:hypothetical protein
MFEFKFHMWFDIFLKLIEFSTNFRSSTHLNFIQTIRLEREKNALCTWAKACPASSPANHMGWQPTTETGEPCSMLTVRGNLVKSGEPGSPGGQGGV